MRRGECGIGMNASKGGMAAATGHTTLPRFPPGSVGALSA